MHSDARTQVVGLGPTELSGMFCIQRIKRLIAGLAFTAMLAPVLVVVPCPLHCGGFAETTSHTSCDCRREEQVQPPGRCRHFASPSSDESTGPSGCFTTLPGQNELPTCSCQLNKGQASPTVAGGRYPHALDSFPHSNLIALRAHPSLALGRLVVCEPPVNAVRSLGSLYCRFQV